MRRQQLILSKRKSTKTEIQCGSVTESATVLHVKVQSCGHTVVQLQAVIVKIYVDFRSLPLREESSW